MGEVERLIRLLAAASKEERRRAAEELIAISQHDESVVTTLRTALHDSDPHRRWGAAFVLYRSGVRDGDVFAGALEALGSGDGDVRWAAAEMAVALASGDVGGRGRRIRAMAVDAGAPGRKMALYCLRDLRVHDETVFSDALSACQPGVRLAAAACLGRFPALSRVGVEALLAAVARDPDAGVRRAAVVALRGATNHEADVRVVLERICDESTDRALVKAAERVLAGLAAAHDR